MQEDKVTITVIRDGDKVTVISPYGEKTVVWGDDSNAMIFAVMYGLTGDPSLENTANEAA